MMTTITPVVFIYMARLQERLARRSQRSSNPVGLSEAPVKSPQQTATLLEHA